MKKLPIAIDKNRISLFCKKYHIAFLALFGSILTPNFTDSSDVDFLVKFEKTHTPSLFDLVDMESELCSIVGRQVDLKTPNELSCYFRDEVLAQAEVIYER
ncbi:MAG: nucleotidyltransferase domain-containing protein [Rhabdochlamydiaceae bacterium]|jgi:predicted nucleotidyltransferase